MNDKTYLTYSGYPGGQKSATPRELLNRIPTRVVETAVRKMLPKNKLGDAMYKNYLFTQDQSIITKLSNLKSLHFNQIWKLSTQ